MDIVYFVYAFINHVIHDTRTTTMALISISFFNTIYITKIQVNHISYTKKDMYDDG